MNEVVPQLASAMLAIAFAAGMLVAGQLYIENNSASFTTAPAALIAAGDTNIAKLNLAGKPGVQAMATQIVMNYSGDTRHNFDPTDMQAIAEAEDRFKELTRVGFTAAVRTPTGEAAVARAFDPTAEETLFFPRLVGG
jgi:hypothetical protein